MNSRSAVQASEKGANCAQVTAQGRGSTTMASLDASRHRVSKVRAILVSAALVCALTSCGASSGNSSPAGARCSDLNPSNVALTFAAIVCVQSQTVVPQTDGSSELMVRITITDKDPNAFNLTTADFKVVDTAGRDVAVDPAKIDGRARSGDCVYQQETDTGWPVSPRATFTVPGSICFNVVSGQHPRQLVWQDDVAVALS